jgi:hypothetical protein
LIDSNKTSLAQWKHYSAVFWFLFSLDYKINGWKRREINYNEIFMMIRDIKALVSRFLKFHHETLSPEGASVSP